MNNFPSSHFSIPNPPLAAESSGGTGHHRVVGESDSLLLDAASSSAAVPSSSPGALRSRIIIDPHRNADSILAIYQNLVDPKSEIAIVGSIRATCIARNCFVY